VENDVDSFSKIVLIGFDFEETGRLGDLIDPPERPGKGLT